MNVIESTEQPTKMRILEAAAAEFAELGYDGARVDNIAKRANVNKALIYYYYRNKEELLDLLLQEMITQVMDLIAKLKNEDSSFFQHKDAITKMLYAFLDLLEERQNVVRVLLMELSKRTPINKRIFDMLGQYLEAIFSVSAGVIENPPSDMPKAMIAEFFTGIMPILNYVAYHEIWMERFGIDEATLRANFIESFIGTHMAYTIPGLEHDHMYDAKA